MQVTKKFYLGVNFHTSAQIGAKSHYLDRNFSVFRNIHGSGVSLVGTHTFVMFFGTENRSQNERNPSHCRKNRKSQHPGSNPRPPGLNLQPRPVGGHNFPTAANQKLIFCTATPTITRKRNRYLILVTPDMPKYFWYSANRPDCTSLSPAAVRTSIQTERLAIPNPSEVVIDPVTAESILH